MYICVYVYISLYIYIYIYIYVLTLHCSISHGTASHGPVLYCICYCVERRLFACCVELHRAVYFMLYRTLVYSIA